MLSTLFLVLSFLTTLANATPCNDGWESPSSGRGTCSHHGGIAGGSVEYYPTQLPAASAYSAPTPVTQAPAPMIYNNLVFTDPDYWVSQDGWQYNKFITLDGSVGHSLNGVTSNDPEHHMVMTYKCFFFEAGHYEEYLSLSLNGLTSTRGHKLIDQWITSVDDNSAVRVYAVKGNMSTFLPSWKASMKNGLLKLSKWTDGIIYDDQLDGMLFLTQGELRTIEQSEDIYVIVAKADGTSSSYKMPMDGFSAAVGLLRQTICPGS